MLLTRARSVPDMALASRLSSAGTKLRVPSLFSTLTWPLRTWVKTPSGPLTVIACAEMATSAPAGTAIGILATRDMCYSLSHEADDFATDTGSARFAIGHDALRSRHDCHAQTVHDGWNLILALVHAQARTGHALEALDDRTASVVLQANL